MTTEDFITALFYEVDEQLGALPKHPEARLWPSEVVTLGLLHARKGVGNRPFSRWLPRDSRALFPRLPERTRLLRLLTTHQDWTRVFLAAPTVLGVIDTYGIELIHPIREGRSPQQIGRKGVSNHRWIVGGKLCLLVNQYGLVVGWACDTANVADNTFQWLIRQFEERMIILSDTGFHAAEGDPSNLKLCQRGKWEERMLVETVLSMLTLVCHFKKVMHRGWAYFQARLAFTMAAFNVLVRWHGLLPNASGFVPLSITGLVCNIPILLFGLSETNTIGYYAPSDFPGRHRAFIRLSPSYFHRPFHSSWDLPCSHSQTSKPCRAAHGQGCGGGRHLYGALS
jgi:hypothetical protein